MKYRNPKGVLSFTDSFKIKKMKEKPVEYINGGFYVLSNKIFKYLKNDKSIFERVLTKLSKKNELIVLSIEVFGLVWIQ